MQDSEIDFGDNPEVTPEMFARAIIALTCRPKKPGYLTYR
jgi:hypothetical protein